MAISNRAANDEVFKSSVIEDPYIVLKEEGVTLEKEGKVNVLDFNSGTLYLILDDRNLSKFYPEMLNKKVESESEFQQKSIQIRTEASNDSGFKKELLANSSHVLIERGIDKNLAPLINVQGFEADAIPNHIVDGAFYASESSCYFPRLFGQSCGASREQIRQHIFSRYSNN